MIMCPNNIWIQNLIVGYLIDVTDLCRLIWNWIDGFMLAQEIELTDYVSWNWIGKFMSDHEIEIYEFMLALIKLNWRIYVGYKMEIYGFMLALMNSNW